MAEIESKDETNKDIMVLGSLAKGSSAFTRLNVDSGKVKIMTNKCDIVYFNKAGGFVVFEDEYQFDRKIGFTVPVQVLKEIIKKIEETPVDVEPSVVS